MVWDHRPRWHESEGGGDDSVSVPCGRGPPRVSEDPGGPTRPAGPGPTGLGQPVCIDQLPDPPLSLDEVQRCLLGSTADAEVVLAMNASALAALPGLVPTLCQLLAHTDGAGCRSDGAGCRSDSAGDNDVELRAMHILRLVCEHDLDRTDELAQQRAGISALFRILRHRAALPPPHAAAVARGDGREKIAAPRNEPGSNVEVAACEEQFGLARRQARQQLAADLLSQVCPLSPFGHLALGDFFLRLRV